MYEMSDYKEEIKKIDINALDKFTVYKNGKIKTKYLVCDYFNLLSNTLYILLSLF